MADLQPTEHRDPESAEPVGEHIEHAPAGVDVPLEPVEQAEGHAGDAVERARANQLGEVPVDLPDPDMAQILEKHDGPGEVRQTGADRTGELPKVAADQATGRDPGHHDGGRQHGRIGRDHQALGSHQKRVHIVGDPVLPEAAVDGGEPGLGQERHVQVRDVAESDDRFRVGSNGIEVDAVDDAVGTGTTPRCEDCAHLWISEGRIEVVEPIGVASGERAMSPRDVFAECDPQTPALELDDQ